MKAKERKAPDPDLCFLLTCHPFLLVVVGTKPGPDLSQCQNSVLRQLKTLRDESRNLRDNVLLLFLLIVIIY